MSVRVVFDLLQDMFLIFIWRLILHQKKRFDMQKFLHRAPMPIPLLFQWPCLMCIMLVYLMGITMNNIFTVAMEECDYLNQELMTKGVIEAQTNGKEGVLKYWGEEMSPDSLKVPTWLKVLSIASPFVGVVALILCFMHMCIVIYKGHNKLVLITPQNQWYYESLNTWEPTKRQDMVMLVIGMPAIFIVMAVRSTDRMWMVMAGQWNPPNFPASVDMALFVENLEAASVFQYYTVLAFSTLCLTCLRSADREMRFAMKYTGFQGVYAYCLIGAVKSTVTFAVAFIRAHPKIFKQWFEPHDLLQKSDIAMEKVDTAFLVVTILCIYNMAMICKLSHVKKVLGKASVKFLATRTLLLISQVQLKIIMQFASPSMTSMAKRIPFLANWHLSVYQGYLMPSTLLTYECLLLVAFNLIVWTVDVTDDVLAEHKTSLIDSSKCSSFESH